ncbi:Tryptophan synthase [Venturia nashicola]|uniref:Tryptophan synthase n=1 Tax=Venturia nashicola TaxID=86259 RepID=A0A4Z1P7Z8_9PEZI|nr:Tryptophan synthase [Venturia nashicola]TLD36906.1 Tryptophan synthase [Venturia nashicola]
MKFTIIATSLALSAAALPAVDPAKPFALEVTANGKTLYLPKGMTGSGTPDVKLAESCVLNAATELVCGGKAVGVAATATVDMAAIKAAPASNAVSKGFSMDADGSLHWGGPDLLKIKAFKKAVSEAPEIYANGEAKFGLFEISGTTSLYFQLGCPGADGKYASPGTHSIMGMGVHNPVYTGTNRAVPL